MVRSTESWASSPGTRRSMQSNRGRDTKPEMEIRRILHGLGYRYRVDMAPVEGTRRRADIVFTRARLAVFIDGCFWHSCPEHATVPNSNAAYWAPKLERNRTRDRETDALLEERGWLVRRFWEHMPPDEVASQVIKLLASRPGSPRPTS